MNTAVRSSDKLFGARQAAGGKVEPTGEQSWRFSLPPGPGNTYRWAQLDDYLKLSRRDFFWRPPVELRLRARVSAPDLPGTWGFGFWNDPFTASIGLGGMARRIPALPNTAWFFYASPPNYLSLRDDLPAQGFLAATFRAPRLPAPLMAFTLPGLPFLAWPAAGRMIRRVSRQLIRQASTLIDTDVSAWHTYSIQWASDRAVFLLDEQVVLETEASPIGPLGFVMWIDNQYAAFTPQGRISFGSLPSPQEAWLEVEALEITSNGTRISAEV
jgi:hypothetical protein